VAGLGWSARVSAVVGAGGGICICRWLVGISRWPLLWWIPFFLPVSRRSWRCESSLGYVLRAWVCQGSGAWGISFASLMPDLETFGEVIEILRSPGTTGCQCSAGVPVVGSVWLPLRCSGWQGRRCVGCGICESTASPWPLQPTVTSMDAASLLGDLATMPIQLLIACYLRAPSDASNLGHVRVHPGLLVGDALCQDGSASSKRCPAWIVRPLLSLGRLPEVVPCHGELPVFFTSWWPFWFLG
jgi:hypothetical protein